MYGAVTLSLTGLVCSTYRAIESWYWSPLRKARASTAGSVNDSLLDEGSTLFEDVYRDGVMNSLLALSMVFGSYRKVSMIKVKNIYAEEIVYNFPASLVSMSAKNLKGYTDDVMPKWAYRIIEFSPQAFDHIRRLDNVTRESILEAIHPDKNLDALIENA